MSDPSYLLFNVDAQKKILRGARAAINLLAPSYGHHTSHTSPHAFGELAQSVQLDDPQEMVGVMCIKKIAESMDAFCGDGTRLAPILLYNFLQEGAQLISPKANLQHVIMGMEKGVKGVVDFIKSNLVKPATLPLTFLTAQLANHNIKGVLPLLRVAYDQVGVDGNIVLEPTRATPQKVTLERGVYFSTSPISGYFVDEPNLGLSELGPGTLHIFDHPLTSTEELLPILIQARQKNHSLIIVAPAISKNALSTLAMNHLQHTLNICCVQKTDKTPIECGLFSKAWVTAYGVTLQRDEDSLLSVVQIANEIDLHLKAHQFLKQVTQHGVVVGGGAVWLHALGSLDQVIATGDEHIGIRLVRQALLAPARQLIENHNKSSGAIIHQIFKKPDSYGYHLITDQIEDLYAQNITDSSAMTIEAIEQALKAATELLLTEVIISNKQTLEE
ncbi:MAG: 60 kDa chaperonin 1 [Chlamydiia bacterium]|nr:60 kDa chaperonin 1 [Chlamydiia bacterium]